LRAKFIYIFFYALFITGCVSVKPHKDFNKLYELPAEYKEGNLKITYYGTTTLLFDDGETQLFFDCFFSRSSLFKTFFSKISTDTATINKLFPQNYLSNLKGVFVAHSHYDHAMDVGYIHQLSNATIYGSTSTLNIARGAKVAENYLVDFTKTSSFTIGKFTIKVVPSIHSKPKWYNNDVGQEITQPLPQPAKYRKYKEGGAFDFLITHGTKTILIRPSINYIPNQWEGIHADVIFLGISQMGKYSNSFLSSFYYETVQRLNPTLVIPFHHDNFFRPLDKEVQFLNGVPKGLRFLMDKTTADSISLSLLNYQSNIYLKTDK